METANHGDNVLKHRWELLSSVHYSKDLQVEDMVGSPLSTTWECTNISTEARRKHRSDAVPRPRRSRSSPVRSGFSGSSSPDRRARSPSVSATRLVLPDPLVLPAPSVLSPHNTIYTKQRPSSVGPSPMSYFSPRPPSMPLYIIPLPSDPSATAAHIEKLIRSQHQSKVKKRDKTGGRIVRHLLDSLLKKLPIEIENAGVDAIRVKIAVKETDISPRYSRSIAIQALSKKITIEEERHSSCSSSESSDAFKWLGTVRALRDSHVRLVLRQLRHLRDIERLDRALRREYAHE